MNDRYLFKAKRVDNGEWVIGQYVNTCRPGNDKETRHCIVVYPNEYYEIYTSTLCQCTGLKDKNGNLIWENDIVECIDKNNDMKFIAIVEFGNPNGFYSWGYQLKHIKGDKPNMNILLWIEMEEAGATCELISNRFDNPELLESEE